MKKSSMRVKESKSSLLMAGPRVSAEVVGNEAAGVARDRGLVLADADARGLFAHDPRPDHGVVRAEARKLVVRLPDEAFGAVLARRLDGLPLRGDRHVGAFARI